MLFPLITKNCSLLELLISKRELKLAKEIVQPRAMDTGGHRRGEKRQVPQVKLTLLLTNRN